MEEELVSGKLVLLDVKVYVDVIVTVLDKVEIFEKNEDDDDVSVVKTCVLEFDSDNRVLLPLLLVMEDVLVLVILCTVLLTWIRVNARAADAVTNPTTKIATDVVVFKP